MDKALVTEMHRQRAKLVIKASAVVPAAWESKARLERYIAQAIAEAERRGGDTGA